MTVMRTVFEEAAETGQTIFLRHWLAIQEMVARGISDDEIRATLRAVLARRRPSARFWQWVGDAITAARHLSDIKANRRRREFRLVK